MNRSSSEQIEKLIDEKCRILNKTGTARSSALHLANWMKGQLDKQQQQARLAAVQSPETVVTLEDDDQDECITYWTRQQLENRTKELNLQHHAVKLQNGLQATAPSTRAATVAKDTALLRDELNNIDADDQLSEDITSQVGFTTLNK